jgi:hypothetical protein
VATSAVLHQDERVTMGPGLEAAIYYDDDDLLVSEELVYDQDGPHSPLVVRPTDGGWGIRCACGYSTRFEEFWEALLVAEGISTRRLKTTRDMTCPRFAPA